MTSVRHGERRGPVRTTNTLLRGGPGVLIAVSLAVSVLAGCSGSASETPWPAEPIDIEPGPAGEERTRGNVVDTKKLPDNYTKKQRAAGASSASPASPAATPDGSDEPPKE